MIYRVYGFIHKIAKHILRQNYKKHIKYIFFSPVTDTIKEYKILFLPFKQKQFINDFFIDKTQTKVFAKTDLFPIENIVSTSVRLPKIVKHHKQPIKKSNTISDFYSAWHDFITSSLIPNGWRYAGFHYAGYIWEKQTWCLPSWIWTNAALARCYFTLGETNLGIELANLFISHQLPEGGWLVRFDIDKDGPIPVIAPNDSAYIATNALLTAYTATSDKRFLVSAEKTAHWIIDTVSPNGLVWLGYDLRHKQWIKNYNIADIGFTSALFAHLYQLIGDNKYLCFLRRFVSAYLNTFYNKKTKCFATAVDEHGNQIGGYFGRGQAWALEGLIPAYMVLKEDYLSKIINDLVEFLLNRQNRNGSWPYNFKNYLMGEDCKGTPVIAYNLLQWYKYNGQKDYRIINAVQKALHWCKKHTCLTGEARGGIFSYTIEGAIVHSLYSSTAFTYSSAYAIEVFKDLQRMNR